MQSSKRWYDAHPEFAERLELLKTARRRKRDQTVAHVLEIITDDSPELLEKYLLDFPLDQKKRRWYDQDPYLWLMVNGLEHAKKKLLQKVTEFLPNADPIKKVTKLSKARGKR